MKVAFKTRVICYLKSNISNTTNNKSHNPDFFLLNHDSRLAIQKNLGEIFGVQLNLSNLNQDLDFSIIRIFPEVIPGPQQRYWSKNPGLVATSIIIMLLVVSAVLPFLSIQPPLGGLPFWSAWDSYLEQLQKRPVLTKCVTSFVGFALGDVAAQILSDDENYDYFRSLRMALYGGLVGGPLAHYWFNLLDMIVLPSRPFSFGAIITKAALDQLIQAPIGLCIFYGYQETMQGRMGQAGATIKKKIIPTLFMTWKFWPLAHLINFSVIPLEQRILYVNVVSVIYTCLLSRLATDKGASTTQKMSIKVQK